jgi:hypothetical protein
MNKPTATVFTVWVDSNGKVVKHSFNIELKKTVVGNYDIEGMRSDALAVIQKLDVLSECRVLAVFLAIPLDFSTTGYKAEATAESSSRRGALAFFKGAPGENQRQESVEILVGDPADAVLDKSGRMIRLDVTKTAVQDFISAFKGKARTTYGETIQDYNTSFYRQKAVTRRSRQAA